MEERSSEDSDSARALMNGLYRGRGGNLKTEGVGGGGTESGCGIGDGVVSLLRTAACKTEALERAGWFKGLRKGWHEISMKPVFSLVVETDVTGSGGVARRYLMVVCFAG